MRCTGISGLAPCLCACGPGSGPVPPAWTPSAGSSDELTWSFRTQRLATSVRLAFGSDGMLRAFVSSAPDFIGLRRDPQTGARTDVFSAPPARRLRTIDLQAGG